MKDRQLNFESVLLPMEVLSMVVADQFNARMLILAREAMGYTQKDLAGEIRSKQGRISKIEAGVLIPDKTDVLNFVDVLKQKWEFFFQQGATMPASVSFYRKTQTMPLKMFRQCNAQMNIRRLEIENKIGDIKMARVELPYLPPEKNGGAKEVAKIVREKWGIKKGAVQHLTRLVEDTGCVIVDYPFSSTKLDGLCIRAPQKPPIIFLNIDFPKSRRRLSLAHELGHLVMHANPHKDVENEAWEFAREFLMPSSEIGRHFDNLSLDKLGELKKEWGISMQAILYYAQTMGRISESSSRYLWMQIGKSGYRVNEPFEDVIPDEKPTELEKRLKIDT